MNYLERLSVRCLAKKIFLNLILSGGGENVTDGVNLAKLFSAVSIIY